MGLDARLRGHDVLLASDLRNRHLGAAPRAKPRRKKGSYFSQWHTASPVRLAVRMTSCAKKCNPSAALPMKWRCFLHVTMRGKI